MKRLLNILIILMLILIPNVYGEEYNYYEIDFSTKEAYINNWSSESSINNSMALSYLERVGKIMTSEIEKEDKYSAFILDENGQLLLKITESYDEEKDEPIIESYEVSENAPEVVEYLFTDEDKEFFNNPSISPSDLPKDGNYAISGKVNPSFLQEYDGIRLRLKEEVLEYTSDKTCTSVCINKVKMVSRTNKNITKDVPKFDGLELNFDLSFKEVNEEVKYEVNIYNPTDKDYEISTPENSSEKDFVKYEYKFENNDNVLKSKSNKTMYVNVRYNKEVDKTSFVDGVFKEENKAVIKLSNGVEETPTPVEVPDTYTGISMVIIFGLIAVLGYVSYNRLSGKMMLLFIPLLLIPVMVFAYERLEVKVNTNVEIEEKKAILMKRPEITRFVLTASPHDLAPSDSNIWYFSNSIISITFENKMREINEYDYKFDASEAQDGSVLAYLVKNNNELTEQDYSYYDVYIMADGDIYANPNSSGVFRDMYNLEAINNMKYFNTSLAVNMEGMFQNCRELKEVDLSHFDTSNVDNMESMFNNTGSNASSFNIIYGDKFIIHDKTNIYNMYCSTGGPAFVPPKDTKEDAICEPEE